MVYSNNYKTIHAYVLKEHMKQGLINNVYYAIKNAKHVSIKIIIV